MFTTSPITVGSPPARIAPTSTSPVLMPMRKRDLRRLVGRELLERLLHLQRGAHTALGVVLVRDRHAEARDERVADDLVELAAERAHVGDEPLERAVDEVLHVLGIGGLRERW